MTLTKKILYREHSVNNKVTDYHLFILNRNLLENASELNIKNGDNYTFINVSTSTQTQFEIACLEVIVKKMDFKNPYSKISELIVLSKFYKADLHYD